MAQDLPVWSEGLQPTVLGVPLFWGVWWDLDGLCLLSVEEAALWPRPGTDAGTVSARPRLVRVCVCVRSVSCIYAKGAALPGQLPGAEAEAQRPMGSGSKP